MRQVNIRFPTHQSGTPQHKTEPHTSTLTSTNSSTLGSCAAKQNVRGRLVCCNGASGPAFLQAFQLRADEGEKLLVWLNLRECILLRHAQHTRFTHTVSEESQQHLECAARADVHDSNATTVWPCSPRKVPVSSVSRQRSSDTYSPASTTASQQQLRPTAH